MRQGAGALGDRTWYLCLGGRCIKGPNRVFQLGDRFIALSFLTVSCTISWQGRCFACFRYDFVRKVAVVDCFWYDVVLRCRFTVRFRTNVVVAVFDCCFWYYFVPKRSYDIVLMSLFCLFPVLRLMRRSPSQNSRFGP